MQANGSAAIAGSAICVCACNAEMRIVETAGRNIAKINGARVLVITVNGGVEAPIQYITSVNRAGIEIIAVNNRIDAPNQ